MFCYKCVTTSCALHLRAGFEVLDKIFALQPMDRHRFTVLPTALKEMGGQAVDVFLASSECRVLYVSVEPP